MELPDVAMLARSLAGRTRYPDALVQLDADRLPRRSASGTCGRPGCTEERHPALRRQDAHNWMHAASST